MKFFLLLCLSLATIGAKAQKASTIVVAEVNGEKITKWELEVYHARRLSLVNQTRATKTQSLNEMIQRRIGIQEAVKSGLTEDADVRRRMNDVLYHQKVSRDLTPKFKDIVVEPKEIQDYYSKNPEYKSSHILYRLPVKPKPEEVKAAFVSMLEIYKKLENNPGRWKEMVKNNSMAKNLPEDGNIGFQPREKLAPEYFNIIDGKKVGFISRPVRTQYGYHIIKLTGKNTFKDINGSLYRKFVYDSKRDKIISDYFANLKKKSKIRIYEREI